jgi:hypothetical protein
MYPCAALGCTAITDGHYCEYHREVCESCTHDVERGLLVRGVCDACTDHRLVEASRVAVAIDTSAYSIGGPVSMRRSGVEVAHKDQDGVWHVGKASR